LSLCADRERHFRPEPRPNLFDIKSGCYCP
jgi:hypothetical protein